VAANVASVIEDGSCLGFTFGPLFEALPRHLAGKKDLGIHTPLSPMRSCPWLKAVR
jgi:hypothetical protein